MPAVATIGVYGFTLDRFLDTLRGADVRLLLDVRQRRGVRGSEYAWANSARLQSALAASGIAYRHHKELRRRPSCAGSSTARTTGSASASAHGRSSRLPTASAT